MTSELPQRTAQDSVVAQALGGSMVVAQTLQQDTPRRVLLEALPSVSPHSLPPGRALKWIVVDSSRIAGFASKNGYKNYLVVPQVNVAGDSASVLVLTRWTPPLGDFAKGTTFREMCFNVLVTFRRIHDQWQQVSFACQPS
jgi:hypothetical protein